VDIDLENEVELNLNDLVQALLGNTAFIQQVALAVRNQLTKDARRMGNIYGKNAQQQPPLPSTNQKRVQ
jgi:hypothetical protein